MKIVIYSVLNFSLLAPQISHNKTFNVVTAMLQQAKRGKKGREKGAGSNAKLALIEII